MITSDVAANEALLAAAVERSSFYVARNEEITEELLAFAATRLPGLPVAKKFSNRSKKLEDAGKTLNYGTTTPEIKAGLDVSRAEEWKKWGQFFAARPIRGKDLKKLIDEGHEILPTRWVDKDRN